VQIPTAKHPKTFGFSSHTASPTIQRSSPRFFSLSSPSTASNGRRARPNILAFSLRVCKYQARSIQKPLVTVVEHNQMFLLFPSEYANTKGEASKNLWFSNGRRE